MGETRYFPVFLDLSETQILVVGAGKIAARRVQSLLGFAGKITVVAPTFHARFAELKEAAGTTVLELIRRPFEGADLTGADLVLALTDDAALNTEIAACCREQNIPVNTGQDKALCDFYFPGIAQKDPVVVGVTASGKDHALARKVTEEVQKLLDSFPNDRE